MSRAALSNLERNGKPGTGRGCTSSALRIPLLGNMPPAPCCGAFKSAIQASHTSGTVGTFRAYNQYKEPGRRCIGDRFQLDGEVKISASPRIRGRVGVRGIKLEWAGLLPEHITFAGSVCIDEEASFSQLLAEFTTREILFSAVTGLGRAIVKGLQAYNRFVEAGEKMLGLVDDTDSLTDLLSGLSEDERKTVENCAKSAALPQRDGILRSIGGVNDRYINAAAVISARGGFYTSKTGAEFHLRRRPAVSFIKERDSYLGYLPSNYTPQYLPDGFFQCVSGEIRYQRVVPSWTTTRAQVEEKACESPQEPIAGRIPDGLVQCDSGEIRFKPFFQFLELGDEVRTATREGICGLQKLSHPEEIHLSKPPTPIPTAAPLPTPIPTLAPLPTSIPTFTAITTGFWHSCGLSSPGQIVCWGAERSPAMGYTNAPSGEYDTIAAGSYHTCAIKTDGTAVCWGLSGDGQLDVPPGTFTAISGGHFHTCAIKTDGTAVCWGNNDDGQTDAPEGQFTAISAGGSHSCALTTQGRAVCWGSNHAGQLDAPEGQFTDIGAANAWSCALTRQDQIICWGLTNAPSGTFTALSVGARHSCALTTQGRAVCWGVNLAGQTDAPSGTFAAISASRGSHTCALTAQGRAVCWGESEDGQLDVPR